MKIVNKLIRYSVSQYALILVIVCLGSNTLRAQIEYSTADWGIQKMDYSRVGTAGFQFLKLPTNARGLGSGGVLSSMSFGDASAAFLNPAAAADVKSSDVLFSTMNWVADIQLHSISAIHTLPHWGTFGINLLYLNYGDMIRTEYQPDDFGNILPKTEGLGTFSAHDMAVGVLYSRQITTQLQIGGNLRYIEEQLDDANTWTWSVDIGTMYYTGIGSWRISMLGKNFGPDASFTSYKGRLERDPVQVRMPMQLVLGTAYDIFDLKSKDPLRLTVAAEYIKPNDGPEKVNVGVEGYFMEYFYFRGGYRFNYDEDTFTFGIGAAYAVEDDIRIRFDYAFAKLGRFNSVNMLTAGFEF
jgi:hypothetical protein